MTTMREKLIYAAAVADGDVEAISGYAPGTPEFMQAAIDNYAGTIDAILDTLREPDEATTDAGLLVFLKGLGKNPPAERPSAAIFTAMIDHVRKG